MLSAHHRGALEWLLFCCFLPGFKLIENKPKILSAKIPHNYTSFAIEFLIDAKLFRLGLGFTLFFDMLTFSLV